MILNYKNTKGQSCTKVVKGIDFLSNETEVLVEADDGAFLLDIRDIISVREDADLTEDCKTCEHKDRCVNIKKVEKE